MTSASPAQRSRRRGRPRVHQLVAIPGARIGSRRVVADEPGRINGSRRVWTLCDCGRLSATLVKRGTVPPICQRCKLGWLLRSKSRGTGQSDRTRLARAVFAAGYTPTYHSFVLADWWLSLGSERADEDRARNALRLAPSLTIHECAALGGGRIGWEHAST